jgi:hypothetical protein
MSDKTSKTKKPAKRGKAETSVLGSLPATRPNRLGRRAAAATSDGTPVQAPVAKAKPKPAKAKPAKAKPRTAAKAKPTAAKPRRAAPARPPVTPTPPVAPPRPEREPVTAASDGNGLPSGPALVTTAVQAAGEIAQIGFTLGGQALRRAARRLPGL